MAFLELGDKCAVGVDHRLELYLILGGRSEDFATNYTNYTNSIKDNAADYADFRGWFVLLD